MRCGADAAPAFLLRLDLEELLDSRAAVPEDCEEEEELLCTPALELFDEEPERACPACGDTECFGECARQIRAPFRRAA